MIIQSMMANHNSDHPLGAATQSASSSSCSSLQEADVGAIGRNQLPADQLQLATQLRRVLRRERRAACRRLREFNWALLIVVRKFEASERLRYRCSLNRLNGHIAECRAELRHNRRQHRLLETAIVTGQVDRVQEMREWWATTG